MKKIVVVMFALLMVANKAFAFNTFGHQALSYMTEMHLTEKAKAEINDILQNPIHKECVWLNDLRKKAEFAHTKDWHFVHLDIDGKSVTTNDNDCVVQLEKSIAILRDRGNHNLSTIQDALRIVIHLVQDMHCLSHYHIEGRDETVQGFSFRVWDEQNSKHSSSWFVTWWGNWESAYINRYTIFTSQYYAEDINLYAPDKKEEYSAGTPRFWAENVGEDVFRALKDFYTGEEVRIIHQLTYEHVHDKCMCKAAYRLAALLNDIFK